MESHVVPCLRVVATQCSACDLTYQFILMHTCAHNGIEHASYARVDIDACIMCARIVTAAVAIIIRLKSLTGNVTKVQLSAVKLTLFTANVRIMVIQKIIFSWV